MLHGRRHTHLDSTWGASSRSGRGPTPAPAPPAQGAPAEGAGAARPRGAGCAPVPAAPAADKAAAVAACVSEAVRQKEAVGKKNLSSKQVETIAGLAYCKPLQVS